MFYYLGNKVSIVDDKNRKKRNQQKSWTYGYHEDIDVIIISKDGTLGEIFNVNGLNIGLPEKPAEEDIINSGITSFNQVWKREEMPKGMNVDNDHKPEFDSFIEKHVYRRKHGTFIYLGGKLVYLAPTYYFFVQWIREGNAYPTLRIIQNELMLYWEACKADERCYGVAYTKNRRFGWSALCFTEQLEAGTRSENKLLGIVSKRGGDAKKIFNRMVRSFKRLPYFFKPEVDGTSTPKSELIFAAPTKKRKKGEEIEEDADGLDTSITWHNTDLNAMDGDEIFRSMLDEVGKFPKETPFSEYWSIVRTSHEIGSEIVGKSMVGSTVNALKKGGSEYMSVYYDSDPYKRDENGQTVSGLYKIFIPARYCLAGFFDIYGFSIVEDPKEPMINDKGKVVKIGSKTFLQNKLTGLKGKPEKYNERLRQYPDTEEDAFRDEASASQFDLMKIMGQISYNTQELNDQFDGEKFFYGNDMVLQGSLVWKDGIEDGEVIFVPSKEGPFFIRKDCFPPDTVRNKKELRYKKDTGVTSFTPVVTEDNGCFGADPFNRDFDIEGRASKGAIHLYLGVNNLGLPSNTFAMEYIFRPRTVRMYFEDLIKACVFWSMPALPELSNEALQQYFIDRGYRNYILNNPFKMESELSANEKLYGGVPPQGDKVADKQFYTIQEYIDIHVGEALDEAYRKLGQMGSMYFTRTLLQWKDFSPSEKRTKYDAYISSSLARCGCNRRTIKNKTEPPKPINVRSLLRTYNNNGSVSTRTKTR